MDKKRIKQLFCRHKNAIPTDRKSYILNGMEKVQEITYLCPDCGKIFSKIEKDKDIKMRNDCKHSYSCKVRVLSAEFAKLNGIEVKEVPCCLCCSYFEMKTETEDNKDE